MLRIKPLNVLQYRHGGTVAILGTVNSILWVFYGVVCVVALPFWHFCWCRGFCRRTELDLFLFLLMLLCVVYIQCQIGFIGSFRGSDDSPRNFYQKLEHHLIRIIFLNDRRMHRFIPCQNYMMSRWFCTPLPHLRQCLALFIICGRRRMAVIRHRMICLLIAITFSRQRHWASLIFQSRSEQDFFVKSKSH